jgi:hypothetical protein
MGRRERIANGRLGTYTSLAPDKTIRTLQILGGRRTHAIAHHRLRHWNWRGGVEGAWQRDRRNVVDDRGHWVRRWVGRRVGRWRVVFDVRGHYGRGGGEDGHDHGCCEGEGELHCDCDGLERLENTMAQRGRRGCEENIVRLRDNDATRRKESDWRWLVTCTHFALHPRVPRANVHPCDHQTLRPKVLGVRNARVAEKRILDLRLLEDCRSAEDIGYNSLASHQ